MIDRGVVSCFFLGFGISVMNEKQIDANEMFLSGSCSAGAAPETETTHGRLIRRRCSKFYYPS